MTVFDAFVNTSYIFLQVKRGGIEGNTVQAQFSAMGIYKLRSNLVRGANEETKDSNATLHIKPTEVFLEANGDNLVGHGILVHNRTYEIIGQTGGMNYDTGQMEHYTLTLQESDFNSVGGSHES